MTMRRMREHLARLTREDDGGEVLEWVLIAGLISVVAIAIIASVGTKVLARWNTIDGSL